MLKHHRFPAARKVKSKARGEVKNSNGDDIRFEIGQLNFMLDIKLDEQFRKIGINLLQLAHFCQNSGVEVPLYLCYSRFQLKTFCQPIPLSVLFSFSPTKSFVWLNLF